MKKIKIVLVEILFVRKVSKSCFLDPENIVGITIAYNNALKATCRKEGQNMYMLVVEFDYEKIKSAKTSKHEIF